MAKKKSDPKPEQAQGPNDDFSGELISALNKEFGTRIAYNLKNDDSPVHVKRWISTGSTLLDYAIANKKGGGCPEGRIIEISGPPSTGKSHIAFQIARTIQRMGGLVVYIDTENATPVEKLAHMGIDVSKRFVYCDTHCTEEVFQIAEATIKKASTIMKTKGTSPPILVVWDSVAATSPKAELEGDYDVNTVGLQARTISKGMRKITGVIGQNNVTMCCLNQIRMKIGVMFGDPTVTPGGMAIPFHSSVRIQLNGGSAEKDKDGNVIGINVTAKIIKNKVAPPQRKVAFKILFGEGIDESDALFEELYQACKKRPVQIGDVLCSIEGASAWRTFNIVDATTGEVLDEKKFQKAGFNALMKDEKYGPLIEEMIDQVLTVQTAGALPPDLDEEEPPEDE